MDSESWDLFFFSFMFAESKNLLSYEIRVEMPHMFYPRFLYAFVSSRTMELLHTANASLPATVYKLLNHDIGTGLPSLLPHTSLMDLYLSQFLYR